MSTLFIFAAFCQFPVNRMNTVFWEIVASKTLKPVFVITAPRLNIENSWSCYFIDHYFRKARQGRTIFPVFHLFYLPWCTYIQQCSRLFTWPRLHFICGRQITADILSKSLWELSWITNFPGDMCLRDLPPLN